MSALHCVVDSREDPVNNLKLIGLLLRGGTNINTCSHMGTALWYAIIREKLRTATILIACGANVNVREEKSYIDTLSVSIKYNDIAIVRLIVNSGFRFQGMLINMKTVAMRTSPEIFEFIQYRSKNPMTLFDCCSWTIRKTLAGPEYFKKVTALQLPVTIKSVLLLGLEELA